MKRTGQILKEARERKGVTINEVSLVTKINAKILDALERGAVDDLPQKAFLRGFVQTYAKYLGLNQSDVLSLFQEEMGQTKPSLPQPGEEGSAPIVDTTGQNLRGLDEKDLGGDSQKWVVGVGALVLLVLIGIVSQLIQKYQRESEIPEKPATLATLADTSNTTAGLLSATTLTGQISSTTLELKNGSTTTMMTTTTEVAATLTTTSTTVSTTTTKITSTTTTTQKATTTTVANSSTTTTQTKAGFFEVIVEALDKVTLEIQLDGKSPRKMEMAPDQIATFRASQGLSLEVSDGGAVNVIYNGIDRGVPGSLGKPTKIKFP